MKFTEAPANHGTPGKILDAVKPVLPMMLHGSAACGAERQKLTGCVEASGVSKNRLNIPQRAAAICLRSVNVCTVKRFSRDTSERLKHKRENPLRLTDPSLCGASDFTSTSKNCLYFFIYSFTNKTLRTAHLCMLHSGRRSTYKHAARSHYNK